MAGLATPLASATARARVAPPPSRAPRRNVRAQARGDVFVSNASRRAGTHRRDVSARVGLSDPGYWESVTALMTPSVAVDLSPPSLAALAIGGVLVLGHSWESILASRGWKDAKCLKDAEKNAPTTTTASPATRNNKTNKTNAVNQKILTTAEREASTAEARASRVLAVAAKRADSEMRKNDSSGVRANSQGVSTSPVRIEVCTNNACAKRGGKELLRALEEMADVMSWSSSSSNIKVECRRSRCMDACSLACVVRVNGVCGLERHAHVGADEAKEIFELATGVKVLSSGE